jgi:antitoxin (DNA-binding transcriptional repressor) of toxin-antitoxin stability system
MKKVNISTIKAELSKYLRFAKAGQEILIMDRDQPVAKLVGVGVPTSCHITEPKSNLKETLQKADSRSFSETNDILKTLLEDREDRF